MIYFHSRRNISLSLFEESSKETANSDTPVKRGRGRPPKLKAVVTPATEKNDFSKKEEIILSSISSETESLNDTNEIEENIDSLSPEDVPREEATQSVNWDSEQMTTFEMEDEIQQFDESLESFEEEFCDEEESQQISETRDFSQNHVALNFSWSLMNQLRQMSKMEGIAVEDLLVELVAEGVAKRVFEDQMRPTPSHLMTRTGYVHSDGTQAAPQPHLSHHMMNNNRQLPNNMQNRNNNRFNFQQRNQQHQTNRNSNNNNRNYQQGNNNRQMNNNGQNGFRNQYNNNTQQQRFHSRSNYQNTQRFYDDQSNSSQQQAGNQYRPQRDTNKR